MKTLLIELGKRVRELRVAKEWSQEEFAHVSGLHRTYIGQIERGEKNISFENLVRVSAVLGVTVSELLSVLDGEGKAVASRQPHESERQKTTSVQRSFDIQKLLTRLRHQRAALDRTLTLLDELMAASSQAGQRGREGQYARPKPTTQKKRAK